MNYVERLRAELVLLLPLLPITLIDFYTLLGLTCGDTVTNEDVHDAWAIWTNTRTPHHADLLPYDELNKDTQAKDGYYAEKISEAVRLVRQSD